MNTPTAPAFDIEVRTPVDGVFVLDRSELDGPDLLATDPAAGFTWLSIKCDATRIETWRGAQADGVDIKVDVGTLTVATVVDPEIVAAADLQTGAPIRLRTTGSTPATLGTFTINDAVVTEDKLKDHAHLQLTATDAVSTLANSIRYGAANPTAGGEPWPARVARLMASANVPTDVPPLLPLSVTVLDNQPADEVGKWTGGTWTLTERGYVKTSSSGISTREFTDLTPGKVYGLLIVFNATTSTMGDVWRGGQNNYDDAFAAGEFGFFRMEPDWADSRETVTIAFDFTARSTTEIVTLSGGTNAAIQRLELREYPRTTWAANIVTETNLARHLDIVAATAGRGWYVDRHGITRIATTVGPTLSHFSDVHDPLDPLHVCYTHITPAWGTDDVINDIAIDNITRRRNDDDTAWEDARTYLGPYRDKISAARWGRRAASVETSIYTPPPRPKELEEGYNGPLWLQWWRRVEPRYSDDAERLARSALARFATPKPRFKQLTFNALDFPDLTAALDIYETVNVTRSDVTQLSTVVSIAHQITATRWLTTLGLIEQDSTHV